MADKKKGAGDEPAPGTEKQRDLHPQNTTEVVTGQVPPIDYFNVLYQHFLEMRGHLVAGDKQTAAIYAEHWKRVWITEFDQKQRANLYDSYRGAIESLLPNEDTRTLAYTLLGITPEERDPVEALAEQFDVELPTPENGTEPKPTEFTPGSRCTDMGNAERLVRQHGDVLRYCHAWHKWLAWTGRRWTDDDTGAVIRLAKKTVRSIYAEASEIEEDEVRQKVARWAHRSESKTRLDAMLGLAQSEPGIPVRPDQLDQDAWLLNVTNGTLDLRTGDLRPHAGGDLLTKYAPVAYDSDALCPTWDSFLSHTMAGNEDKITFLQRAVGYSLTSDTSEQVIFILYGTGANGKSTLLGTLGDLLNDYARQTGTDTLLVKKSDSISNDVARLKGARLVTAVEAGDGRRMAENLVKQMTGGDRISARFLYTEAFEFMPTFKIWLATNHKPTIRGTDHAIWRRIRLIPFDVTIPEAEQDKALPHKLRAELPGILAWAVRGCLAWQRAGLGLPEEVREATKVYQNEMDTMGAFLADCCVIEEATQTRAKELYTVYAEWCDDNGEYKITGTAFGRRMAERGFDKYRDEKGNIYVGLGLLADETL